MVANHYRVPSATAAAIAAMKLQEQGLEAFVSPPEVADGPIPLTVISDRYDVDEVVMNIEPSATRAGDTDREDHEQ